ncbi:hypothetical protein L1987_70524 [Smallanthus sonchifolius]|uniref:Uncharacterized protein n=1 Tax=Smallanthus sonchifolius TaxID=185202 RepID=A0ACB9AQR3_9ASTR|nr:hypothetical protein L1987_70524 [Smallanthus sonchifolius]
MFFDAGSCLWMLRLYVVDINFIMWFRRLPFTTADWEDAAVLMVVTVPFPLPIELIRYSQFCSISLGLGLVSLLRIAWIAATLPILVAWLPFPGLGWFRRALLGFARRGKILQSNTKLTVPQRFFSHFYAVAISWTTILLAAVWYYGIRMLPSLSEQDLFSTITSHVSGGSHAFSLHKSLSVREHVYNVWLSVFLLLLMEVQVLRRFYETIYVCNYSPSARMHAGLFFYTAAPLSLCCTFAPEVFDFAKNLVAEFIVKGKDRMSRPEFNIWMFVAPFSRLRCFFPPKNDDKMLHRTLAFQIVTVFLCNLFLVSVKVIYAGLLVASGGADFSLWYVANLVFAAAETQRWYLHKFDDYPPDRVLQRLTRIMVHNSTNTDD